MQALQETDYWDSYFLPPRLTGAVYHDFLLNYHPELLQSVDLHTTRIHLWFMHDGAPSHFLLAVREFLNVFPAHWMGGDGPTAWPARSPDLKS